MPLCADESPHLFSWLGEETYETYAAESSVVVGSVCVRLGMDPLHVQDYPGAPVGALPGLGFARWTRAAAPCYHSTGSLVERSVA